MAQLEQQMNRLLAEQASEWVEVMKRPTLLDRLMFARWLRKHERNATEFIAMEAVDRALEGIDAQRCHDVTALLSASSDIVSLGEGPRSQAGARKPARGRWRAGLAAAAAIGAVAVIAWWGVSVLGLTGQEVSTRIGEQRVLALEDGSTVFVNTQSRVRVRLSNRARDIQLLAGEALFKVEPDPLRPFRVHAGDATIRAIGTQFNVHRGPAGTQVAVIEGRVEISSEPGPERPAARTALAAGEEASIAASKPVVKRAAADLEKTTAWRQRRLVFRLEPLADIAAEFNRYNRAPRIRVEGDVTRERRLSGVFDADDPQAFAAMLGGDETLTIATMDGEIVIRGRGNEPRPRALDH